MCNKLVAVDIMIILINDHSMIHECHARWFIFRDDHSMIHTYHDKWLLLDIIIYTNDHSMIHTYCGLL